MFLYQPKSICVPPDKEIARVVPKLSSLTKEEQKRFDSKTIFYDVFFDKHALKLRALGPRPLNLSNELFPLSIYVNDYPVKSRLDEVERLIFLESDTLSDVYGDQLLVKFEFKSFVKSIELNLSDSNSWEQGFGEARLSISTLQKDNHIEWIEDWIKWHCRLYDVKRLLLYDNASSNRDELVLRLKNIKDEVKIMFVDWNFPYGVEPYEYAQQGALNHARLLFPIQDAYCINLDIDEYLVKPHGSRLIDFLKLKMKDPNIGAVTFVQYMVPNIARSEPNELPRVFDFPYRFIKSGKPQEQPGKRYSWSRMARMKYIYHFNRIGYNGTHRTISEKNKMFSEKYSIGHKFKFNLKKIVRDLFSKVIGNRFPRPKIDACHVSENELYFLHFLGLTTGWKKNTLLEKVNFNKEVHTKEPLIHELAKRANILPATDE